MPQAHVTCVVNDPGSGASYNRVEWNVNGMTISSIQTTVYPGQVFEIDVPENSTVRLDVGAFNSEGGSTWASSPVFNVGAAPPPPPAPLPGSPAVGQPTVSYWW